MKNHMTLATAEELAQEARCRAAYQLALVKLAKAGATFSQRMEACEEMYKAQLLPEHAFAFLSVQAAEEILAQPESALDATTRDIEPLPNCDSVDDRMLKYFVSFNVPDEMSSKALAYLHCYDAQESREYIHNKLLAGQYWCCMGTVQNAYFGASGGHELN